MKRNVDPSLITMTDSQIASTRTVHRAYLAVGDMWTLNYLPGRQFHREVALAAVLGAVAFDAGQPLDPNLARALGLTDLELAGLIAMVSR